MGAETKQIDPAALATLTTGIVMVESFSAVHEAAEWLLGHPVWTHEFVVPEIKRALIDEVLRQFPDMPTEKPEDWATCRLSLHSTYGDTVAVKKGKRERTVDPVTSAIGIKEALSLATGDE